MGGISMDNSIQREAIELFSKNIKEKLSFNIKDVRLFGSVVRGTDTPDSDIDILVMVEKDDRDTSDAIMDIVVDINLEYDVVIIPIIITCLLIHISEPTRLGMISYAVF